MPRACSRETPPASQTVQKQPEKNNSVQTALFSCPLIRSLLSLLSLPAFLDLLSSGPEAPFLLLLLLLAAEEPLNRGTPRPRLRDTLSPVGPRTLYKCTACFFYQPDFRHENEVVIGKATFRSSSTRYLCSNRRSVECQLTIPCRVSRPARQEPERQLDQSARGVKFVALHHPTTSLPTGPHFPCSIYTRARPGASDVITLLTRDGGGRRRRRQGLLRLLRDDEAARDGVLAAAAEADHPGAARREPGQPRHVGLLHHPGLPHPAHPPRGRAGARRREGHPRRRLLLLLARGRPRPQLEGLLLRLPLRAHPRHAARDRRRLPPRPRHRRPRGVPRPRAGLRQLPGRGADARHQGDPRAVRPVLLPVPRGRVRRRRLRPRRQFPRVTVAGHRQREAGSDHQLRDQPGDRLARPHLARLHDEVVQVDGGAVRAPQQLRELRVQGHAARPRRRVQPPHAPHQGGARGMGTLAGDDHRPAVARLSQPTQLVRGVLLIHRHLLRQLERSASGRRLPGRRRSLQDQVSGGVTNRSRSSFSFFTNSSNSILHASFILSTLFADSKESEEENAMIELLKYPN